MKRTPLGQSIAQAVSERLTLGWDGDGAAVENMASDDRYFSGYGDVDGVGLGLGSTWGSGTMNSRGWGSPGDFPTVGIDIICYA